MNRKTKVVLALWFSLTALVALAATVPNPYNARFINIEGTTEYYWQYPLLFGVVAAIAAIAIQPWRSEHSALGGGVSFVLFSAIVTWSFLGGMHAPMAHAFFFFESLLMSQVALFYCGFAHGSRKSAIKRAENAV